MSYYDMDEDYILRDSEDPYAAPKAAVKLDPNACPKCGKMLHPKGRHFHIQSCGGVGGSLPKAN